MQESIHTAIGKVMEEVGYVKKAKAASLNYTFAGEAALIAALRPAMVENGIYMHILEVKEMRRESYATKSGTAMTNTVVSAVVRFMHSPTGTYIDVAAMGEGSDAGDKSANKAMTGLYKYALRQTFCIETGDDPDKHQPEGKSENKKSEAGTPVTVKAVMDAKWASPEPHAQKLIEILKIGGTTMDKATPIFNIYKVWRTTAGLEPSAAAAKALSGEIYNPKQEG